MTERDAKELEQELTDARARIADLERALETARRSNDRADRMAILGTMVAGVAHDINTPMGAIKANTDLIARSIQMLQKAFDSDAFKEVVAGDRKVQRARDILEQSNDTTKLAAERIIELVRSLRTFSRDSGEKEELDLHESLEATLAVLNHQLKRGVEVVKSYGTVPRCKFRPGQLSQVFMNLLVNAVQAMDGQGKITIETGIDPDQNAVVVRIRDTGRGIAPEVLPKIFDSGFTTKSAEAGTGLGLGICRRIVEEHLGEIGCQSEVGVGTTFTLRLPCVGGAGA